jgi:hypothetical protein
MSLQINNCIQTEMLKWAYLKRGGRNCGGFLHPVHKARKHESLELFNHK